MLVRATPIVVHTPVWSGIRVSKFWTKSQIDRVITHLILWLLFGHVGNASNNASDSATDNASCSGDCSLRMLSDVVGLICEDSWDAILHKPDAFCIY